MNVRYWVKKRIMTPFVRSIRHKLLLYTTVLVIVPLIVAVIISWKNSKNAMERVILNENISKMEWVQEEFLEDYHRIDEALTAFFFDSDIQFYNDKLKKGAQWQREAIDFFHTKLKAYLLANFTDFVTVTFYSFESNRTITVSYEQDFNIKSVDKESWIYQKIRQEKEGFFYHMEDNDGKTTVKGPYITKPYYRFENQEQIGILLVELNWNLFDKAAELLNTEEGSGVYFFQNSGDLIYQKGEKPISEDVYKEVEGMMKSGRIEHVGRNMEPMEAVGDDKRGEEDIATRIIGTNYVFINQLSEELYMVKTLPTSIGTAYYKKTLYSQLLIIGMTGIIVLVFVYIFGTRLIRPLTRLTTSMQSIETVLDNDELPGSVVRTQDEIKVLEQSYFFMIKKIKDLIEMEYKQEIETQHAKIMALQAQINPHFMYNTLQMIGSMAVEKEAMEIYDVIKAFGKMLRYNMQLTKELVTVEEELQHLRQYLQIQKQRFGSKLEVTYKQGLHVENCLLPKLTIQPIVENCFKYGMTPKEHAWQIEIKVWRQKELLCIHVKDNGPGMEKEALDALKQKLEERQGFLFNDKDTIGLKNIQSRIQLHFGNSYKLQLESADGFQVVLQIKAVEEWSDRDVQMHYHR